MPGSVEQEIKYSEVGGIIEIIMDWTADASAATIPDTPTDIDIAGRLEYVTTNPGATKPSSNYDIDLKDEDGVDVMGSALDNRHDTNSEVAYPKDPDGDQIIGGVPVRGPLTLSISGNSVNSAVGRVRLTISR